MPFSVCSLPSMIGRRKGFSLSDQESSWSNSWEGHVWRNSQIFLVEKELLPSYPARLSVGVAWMMVGPCGISVCLCPLLGALLGVPGYQFTGIKAVHSPALNWEAECSLRWTVPWLCSVMSMENGPCPKPGHSPIKCHPQTVVSQADGLRLLLWRVLQQRGVCHGLSCCHYCRECSLSKASHWDDVSRRVDNPATESWWGCICIMLSSLCHPPALIRKEVEKWEMSHGRTTRTGRGLEHTTDEKKRELGLVSLAKRKPRRI